jgi:4-methyl-5(b-hydroxyethyl)-thiazole monophosphate biosynthesis
MPKVLIPLADGFEEIEALALVDVLRRAKIDVVLAGLHPGPTVSARAVSVLTDATIDAVCVSDFDMIILPGGQPGTDTLNADTRIHQLLKEFHENGKLIGAICAAPIVLAAAGILTGRHATCYPSYCSRLDGAVHENRTVVTDGTIMTSQGAGTAVSFALAIVSRLLDPQTAHDISKSMLVYDATTHEIWDQRIFDSLIQSLVGALEMKDSYTQGHARRVTEYALSIGARLKMSDIELRDLYLGAVLHDIGKIGTDDGVLNKTEKLNLREETLMREHPLKGTLFIVGIEKLSHIVPAILHHHERWDGKGYPGRLKGEQIPLHARIVCITDAFDAMMSNRSYRDGINKEHAIVEIQKEKGTQFDPFLVDVFIECLNDSPFEMRDFSYYF